MKNFFRWSAGVIFSFSVLFFSGLVYASSYMPNTYEVNNANDAEFSLFPFSIVNKKYDKDCLSQNGLPKPVSAIKSCLKFLNVFPIKTVYVNVIPKHKVVPCGTPFGVKIHSKGVMITNVSEVNTGFSVKSPAKDAGLKKGDVIISVDGQEVSTNEELEKIINKSKEKNLVLNVMREDKEEKIEVSPVKSADDKEYRLGMWVRDSSSGIGTLTFCDKENGMFAGLGHGVCDIDTGEIIPCGTGDIVPAAITDINKSSSGMPGELKGCITDQNSMGEIYANDKTGIYGGLKDFDAKGEEVEVALKQHVKKGPAYIISTLEGEKPEYYNVNIDSVNYNVNLPTKNIKISITDKRLMEKTGGIVQGMSGSPIMQDGKLIGAVTHVLVNNPSKGYGIFAETMLTNSNNVFESSHKKSP